MVVLLLVLWTDMWREDVVAEVVDVVVVGCRSIMGTDVVATVTLGGLVVALSSLTIEIIF